MAAAPEDLLIRPMRVQDAAGLHVLWTLPGVVWGTNRTPSQTLEQVHQRAERLVDDPNAHALVAELEGKVVGSASLQIGNGKRRYTGGIGIMVHDEHVGRGIGRALMEALLDRADHHLGLKRVELDVIVDNAAAIHLYESLGFEREGIQRCGHFRAGEFVDLLIMGRVRE
jgi:putative acetyltransferase